MPRHARTPLWDDQSPGQQLETLRQLIFDLYRYQLADPLARIQSMLDAHQPADAKEADDIALIKRMIAEHPHIISPSCEVGHITASALIVDLNSQRVLLHYHKRLGRWLQVGGHADYETDVAQVALREAREETGLPDLAFHPVGEPVAPIDYDVHTIPQHGDMPQHLHLDFRYLLSTRCPDALAPAAGESSRFRWMHIDDAFRMPNALDDSLKRLLKKGQAIFCSWNTAD